MKSYGAQICGNLLHTKLGTQYNACFLQTAPTVDDQPMFAGAARFQAYIIVFALLYVVFLEKIVIIVIFLVSLHAQFLSYLGNIPRPIHSLTLTIRQFHPVREL